MLQGLWRIRTSRMRYREASAVQAANASGFFAGVFDLISINTLLRLEYRVYTLSRNDLLLLKIENEWRILAIKDYDVDVVAELTITVDYVGAFRPISGRQIFLKEFQPNTLASVSLGARVA